MWIVAGKTLAGKEVSYKIPVAKDTDKGQVIGLTYAEHSKGAPTDPLDFPSVELTWTADNVQAIPALSLDERCNYVVEKRVGKGVWERSSVRALRTLASASEALEGFSSADKVGKYRVVETRTQTSVVAISKNATGAVNEVPDEPVQEEIPAPAEPTAEVKGKSTAKA